MNINLSIPISRTSYGYVSLNVLRELQKKTNVSLCPITPSDRIYLDSEEKFHSSLRQSLKQPDPKGISLRIFHQFSLERGVGSKHIGWPIFELDKFNDNEKEHLKRCDQLIVCSKWAKNIVESEIGVSPDIVPLGVDTTVFTPRVSEQQKVIFLNVAKIELRKGHDLLVKIFNEAFNQDDNVELWLMWHNPFYSQRNILDWHFHYLNSKLGSKIKILSPVKTSEDVATIMQQADYGIFPSRAEGWNLPLLEMMACGKKSIVTNYSGHTEFCSELNSVLIQPNGKEVAFDNFWFHGQGSWAKLDKEPFIEAMRQLYREGKSKINNDCVATATQLTWENTADELISYL